MESTMLEHIEVQKIGERHAFVRINNSGEVTLKFAGDPEFRAGEVVYDNGFGRYVARTESGSSRFFNQGNNDSGHTVIKRAMRWVARNN
jgi:hypothetical protein